MKRTTYFLVALVASVAGGCKSSSDGPGTDSPTPVSAAAPVSAGASPATAPPSAAASSGAPSSAAQASSATASGPPGAVATAPPSGPAQKASAPPEAEAVPELSEDIGVAIVAAEVLHSGGQMISWLAADHFAVGVLLEATNLGSAVREPPVAKVVIVIDTELGELTCAVSGAKSDPAWFVDPPGASGSWQEFRRWQQARARHVELGARPGGWLDPKRGQSGWPEHLWRPGEAMRFQAIADCADLTLLDSGIKGARVAAAVEAKDMDPFEGSARAVAMPVDFPAARFIAETVILDGGLRGVAAGDRIAYGDGKALRQVSAWTLRAVKRAPVPAKFVPVDVGTDELTVHLASAARTHRTESATVPPQRKRITVSGRVGIDAAAIVRRLQGAVDSSRAKETAAIAVSTAADAALAKAAPNSPEWVQASGGVQAARAAVAQASAGLKGAEAAFARSQASERNRLAFAFPCEQVVLTTSAGPVAPVNGAGLKASCAKLGTADAVDVQWTFDLTRYQMPMVLGLPFKTSAGPKTEVVAVATEETVAIDRR